MQSKNNAYLYTFLTILLWSGSASAFKLSLNHLSPMALLSCSTLISLFLLSILMLQGQRYSKLKELTTGQWLHIGVLGSINPFLYYVILFQAYDLLPGQVAMSLNYLWPVMLAILSVPILGHSLNAKSFFSIALSFGGALLIATQGNFMDWTQLNHTGIILALSSTVVWAVYWLLSARMQVDAVIKLFIGFCSGTVLSVAFAIWSNQFTFDFDDFPWLAVGYVGLFEMGLTFFIWLKALQLTPNAALIGNLIYITPFLSLVMLSLILNESISFSTMLGLMVIIGGILTQQYWNRLESRSS